MLFTSLAFFLFLGLTLLVFVRLPPRWRWPWLLAASLGFYGSFGPVNLVFLAAVTACAWTAGLGIAAARRPVRRLALTLGLVATLGGLAALKYWDFLAGEIEAATGGGVLPRLGIVAPVGFSFYAFMAAAYVIDAWRGALPPEQSAGRLALYVAWFPKILAGPIERAPRLLPQLAAGLRWDPVLVVAGLQLIGWGLVKKVAIADNLGPVVDAAFRIAPYAAPMDLLIAVYFFAFQIYCDFSGYSDIAIGVSLLFGIRLMENFRRPYLAASTAEFWASRWHISLGQWFRDYLYIPLGGGRAGALRRYLNVMAVFVVSGLWHAGLGYGVGWTFLVWGAMNGAYGWVGLATRPLWTRIAVRLPGLARSRALMVLRVLLTFHLILLGWVFFRAESIDQALLVVCRIWTALPGLPALAPNYPFTADHMLGAALILALIVVEVLDERRPITDRLTAAPTALRWTAYYAGLFGLLLLGRWQAEQFIYMQF